MSVAELVLVKQEDSAAYCCKEAFCQRVAMLLKQKDAIFYTMKKHFPILFTFNMHPGHDNPHSVRSSLIMNVYCCIIFSGDSSVKGPNDNIEWIGSIWRALAPWW